MFPRIDLSGATSEARSNLDKSLDQLSTSLNNFPLHLIQQIKADSTNPSALAVVNAMRYFARALHAAAGDEAFADIFGWKPSDDSLLRLHFLLEAALKTHFCEAAYRRRGLWGSILPTEDDTRNVDFDLLLGTLRSICTQNLPNGPTPEKRLRDLRSSVQSFRTWLADTYADTKKINYSRRRPTLVRDDLLDRAIKRGKKQGLSEIGSVMEFAYAKSESQAANWLRTRRRHRAPKR
jgi:hypothetical protein